MSDDDTKKPNWDKAQALNPMEMMVYAVSIAHWEAEIRGEITHELSERMAKRADEIIEAMLNRKAIVKHKGDPTYSIIDQPDGGVVPVSKGPKTPKDVLVIKPKG